jgi:membrane protease subunit (stomatin/prohibitin family)
MSLQEGTDPDMVNEQARRRKPFERAAVAEYEYANANDNDKGDSTGQQNKKVREHTAVEVEKWTCSTCDTSNEISTCTNCGARYAPPVQSGEMGWCDVCQGV